MALMAGCGASGSQVEPMPLDRGTRIKIGLPAKAPPAGFVRAIQRACRNQPVVAEAFLYQVQIIGTGEAPHPAIGLRVRRSLPQAAKATLARSMGDAIDPGAWGYDYVDFPILSGGMLDAVRETVDPICR